MTEKFEQKVNEVRAAINAAEDALSAIARGDKVDSVYIRGSNLSLGDDLGSEIYRLVKLKAEAELSHAQTEFLTLKSTDPQWN